MFNNLLYIIRYYLQNLKVVNWKSKKFLNNNTFVNFYLLKIKNLIKIHIF